MCVVEGELFSLISRHVPAGRNPADEFVALKALPAKKSAVVEERLRALDKCVGRGRELTKSINEAAIVLQSSQRQIYRLLARLREFGPVLGLSPGTFRTGRSEVARGGLSDVAEEVLAARLKENPRASQASLEAAISERCLALGLEPPTQYAVRQRVLQLRAEGKARPVSPFGAKLVLDQIKIDLNVNVAEGKSLPSIATLLMDEGLGLVLGGGLNHSVGTGDLGILIATANTSEALARLGRFEIEIAPRLEQLTWVVPPLLEESSALAGKRGRSPRNKARLKIVRSGPKRHGIEIIRIIGDRLGPYRLFPRQSFSEEFNVVNEAGLPYDEARELLDLAIGSWNRKRLQALGIAETGFSAARDRSLARIVKEFGELLEPVHKAVIAELKAMPVDPDASFPEH